MPGRRQYRRPTGEAHFAGDRSDPAAPAPRQAAAVAVGDVVKKATNRKGGRAVACRKRRPGMGCMVVVPVCRGRMYAAPTNRPGTAGTWARRVPAADRPRRGQDPALQSGGNGRQNGQADICRTPCAARKNRTQIAHLSNVKFRPARGQNCTPHRVKYPAAARGAPFTKISLADPLDAGKPACYTYGAC